MDGYIPGQSRAAHHHLAARFEICADALLEGAQGQGQNDFKVSMARRAIIRALAYATAGTVDNKEHP